MSTHSNHDAAESTPTGAAPAAAWHEPPPPDAQAPPVPQRSSHAPADHLILVVDDEPGMREMMQFELSECGYRVVTANDGMEALEKLEAVEYDLVISDVHMPEADGIAVLEAAKCLAPDTQVIIITAYAELDSALACLRAGAFDLITKPFQLDDFLHTVDRALEHRRLCVTTMLYHACERMLDATSDVPVSERIAKTAMRLLGADDASVMLLDAGGTLRIAYATGLPHAVSDTVRLAWGDRVAGRAAADRSPALWPSAVDDDPRFTGVTLHDPVHSGIIYPLVHGEATFGVLNLNRVGACRPFRRSDLETAGIVAAQAALALHNEQLTQHIAGSERLAAIGQMAAGVVHEINNPLGYIKANITFIRDSLTNLPTTPDGGCKLTAEQLQDLSEAVDDMAGGTELLTTIIGDMRCLSRREGCEHKCLAINDAIGSAMRIAAPTVKHVATIRTELGEGLTVLGSASALGQVFLNLIVNAAHAIESQGRTAGRIDVRSYRDGDNVVVCVIDDGPGIAPDDLARVMEPFFTTKGKDKGSGLGLSISREIVGGHGGELTVASTAGEGASFTVTLPFTPRPAENAGGADSSAPSPPRPATGCEQPVEQSLTE